MHHMPGMPRSWLSSPNGSRCRSRSVGSGDRWPGTRPKSTMSCHAGRSGVQWPGTWPESTMSCHAGRSGDRWPGGATGVDAEQP